MKQKTITFYLLLLTTTQSFAQTKQAILQSYFTGLAANGAFNRNVLVAENGKIIYEQSFGYADFKQKVVNRRNTLFPIASISKLSRLLQFYS